MKKIILILILSVFIIGCAKQETLTKTPTSEPSQVPAEPLETELHPEEEVGTVFHKDFKAVMPEGWKEVEIPPATFMYLIEGADYTDTKTENVNFVITNLPEDYEVKHAGYTPAFVAQDPNRLVPVDVMREREREGEIGKLHNTFYTTSGCASILENSKRMGKSIATKLKHEGVQGAILTST